MGQSSSRSRRPGGDPYQTHPQSAPTPPAPLPPPPTPPPQPASLPPHNPYYGFPPPPLPPATPYNYPNQPQSSSNYRELMCFLESLANNSFPSHYRPNQGNVWLAPGPQPPLSAARRLPSSPSAAARPYIEHQKAKTIKNDVNLHKDKVLLEADERNEEQLLVSFVYDAAADGSVTIYYFAKEGANCSFSSIEEVIYKPRTYAFEQGTGKRFCQPPGHGIDLGFFDLDSLSKPSAGDVFPLVIYAKAHRPTLPDNQSAQSTAAHAQITLAIIEKNSNGAFQAKVVKQILWIDGERYELQEIYGLANSSGETIEDGDEDIGKECVICMTEQRNTAVFPCRHLCMCTDCAKSLRVQSNKCPICRQPVEKLMEINVNELC